MQYTLRKNSRQWHIRKRMQCRGPCFEIRAPLIIRFSHYHHKVCNISANLCIDDIVFFGYLLTIDDDCITRKQNLLVLKMCRQLVEGYGSSIGFAKWKLKGYLI